MACSRACSRSTAPTVPYHRQWAGGATERGARKPHELAAGTAALRSAGLRPASFGGFQPPVLVVPSRCARTEATPSPPPDGGEGWEEEDDAAINTYSASCRQRNWTSLRSLRQIRHRVCAGGRRVNGRYCSARGD